MELRKISVAWYALLETAYGAHFFLSIVGRGSSQHRRQYLMLQGLTYWEFRYPGDSQVPSIVKARASLAVANVTFLRSPE